MKIELQREPSTEHATLGTLTVNGKFECFTLEDVVRPVKIHGETAIPAGTYPVAISFSPRFQRDLPILIGVPNFSGVRIHPGNTAKDTEGCILLGVTKGVDRVDNSRIAFTALWEDLLAAWTKHEAITIEIKDSL